MYAGAVPAIAELVANARDADAPNVWIESPLDEPIETSSEIRVRDDGVGMTFDEANDLYLAVGRDRRVSRTHIHGRRSTGHGWEGAREARWVSALLMWSKSGR